MFLKEGIMEKLLSFLKAIKNWMPVGRKITVGARVLLVQEGKILLVKHTYMPKWYSIGGGVEKRETPLQAIHREAYEEVGIRFLEDPELFGVYLNTFEKNFDDYVILYVAYAFERTAQSSLEIAASRWFDLSALPKDISPATKRRIEEYQGLRPKEDIW